MREIRFRGKTKYGVWVYGGFVKLNDTSYIVKVERQTFEPYSEIATMEEVDPKTVGQSTGLKDRNGREIYEGDILRDEFDRIFRVYWVDGEARFAIRQKKRKTEYFMVISHIHPVVIGNIWDNPELLKGEETA